MLSVSANYKFELCVFAQCFGESTRNSLVKLLAPSKLLEMHWLDLRRYSFLANL